MNRALVLLIACAVATYSFASFAAKRPPDEVRGNNPYRLAPIWISASSALDNSGRLREGALAPAEHDLLLRQSRSIESVPINDGNGDVPCAVTYGALFDDADMPTTPSFRTLSERAAAGSVYRGRVTSTTVGFYSGMPFTLVQISLSRSAPEAFAYILLPKGAVTVNGVRTCTDDNRYVNVPATNDEVLFVGSKSLDRSVLIFRLPAEHIFTAHGGVVVWPYSLTAEARGLGLRTLNETERQLAGKGKRARPRGQSFGNGSHESREGGKS